MMPGRMAWHAKKRAVEHPGVTWTIFGGAGAGALLFGAGFFTLGIGTAVLAAAAGIGIGWYRLTRKSEGYVEERFKELKAQRAAWEQSQVEALVQKCLTANYRVGSKRGQSLIESYQKVRDHIEFRQSQRSTATLERFNRLADDAFKEGLKALSRIIDLNTALKEFDEVKINAEQEELKIQMADPNTRPSQKESAKRKHEANVRLLERITRQRETAQALDDQLVSIETALKTTYLEVGDLGYEDVTDRLKQGGQAHTNLELAVDAARKVEARARGLGVSSAEDDMYENAGR
jgi:hypothetical protein